MPFQSEKQRRFLWAKRPDIAKRWAHEYPESNKGLPMYADKKDKASDAEKAAALRALSLATARFSGDARVLTSATNAANFVKTGMDSILRVDIPHSDKPTYAGQERAEGEQKLEENENETSERAPRDKCDQQGAQALLAKLSAVLAQPYRAEMENEQALAEGREPRFVPQNMGLKRYSVPAPYITPPMGMGAPPPNASAAQGAQTAQQNMPQPGNAPVGGGSNPQHNPIQAFGPLGAKGQLNGNAAFGQKNSPDSLKSAGLKDIFGKGEKLPGWYGAESLIEIPGGGYRYGHTHGVDVVDSTPGWLRRIFDRDPYVMREDVPKYKRKLKAIRGMHVMEQPNRLEFSHMGQLKPEMRQLIEAALTKNASVGTAAIEAAKKVLPNVPNMLLQRAGIGAGVGAVGGGAIGAARAKPGQRLRGAATGAGIGAGIGAGTGAASALLAPYLQRQVAQVRPNLPPPASGNALGFTPKPGPSGGGGAAHGPRSAPKPPPVPPPVPPAPTGRAPMADPPGWNAPFNPDILYADSAAGKAFAASPAAQPRVAAPKPAAPKPAAPKPAAPKPAAPLPRQAAQQAATAKPVRSAAQAQAAQTAREEAARSKFFKNMEVAPGTVPLPREIGAPGSGPFKSYSGGEHIFTEGKVRPTYWDDQVKATGQYFSGVQKGTKIDYPQQYLDALATADHSHRLMPDKFPQIFAPKQSPEQFLSGLKLARFVRPLPPGVKRANNVLGLLASMDFSRLPDPCDLDLDEDDQRSKQAAETPAWQRAAGKNPEGGLNAKGRASYKRETGGTLKAPVTESNPSGERAKRQNSFCSRMCGMKRVNTGAKTKSDPDSRINKSLRKWNCKCGSAADLAVLAGLAQQEKSANFIADLTRNLSGRAGMMTGIFGRKAAPALPSRAAGAAQAAAKKVLSLSTAHPSVLPALAAARKEAVPGARLNELAKFMWNRTPRPVAPPTTRLRMPDGIHMFRRFGDTEAAHAALSNAMQRYTRVGQAAGRIPPLRSTGEFVSFFGDVPTTAKTWGQLQGIVPKRAR